jgi:hypothetical protein
MDKTILDFTGLIGKKILKKYGNFFATTVFLESIKIVIPALKPRSEKETIINIIPIKYKPPKITRPGEMDLVFLYHEYEMSIITDKYLYTAYFYQSDKIEEIKIGHLIYNIEGNLWIKQ